jgi:[ribosomal protein S18]-alanine N-acetyltransferase
MNISGETFELDQKHFPRPWTQAQWDSADPNHHLLIEGSGRFALFALVHGDDTAHLLKIVLSPDLRGSGEAQVFWDELVETLKARGATKVFLEVESTNLRAQGFYRKLGFQKLREVKGFYSDGTDGVLEMLTL